MQIAIDIFVMLGNETECTGMGSLDDAKNKHIFLNKITYEGCSNMNASSFITFVTYMLRQNGIRFYKGLYVTFKLAPDVKKKYSILIEL